MQLEQQEDPKDSFVAITTGGGITTGTQLTVFGIATFGRGFGRAFGMIAAGPVIRIREGFVFVMELANDMRFLIQQN